MATKVMLLLGICALIVSQVESLYQCDPDRRDCSCSDFSYKDCQEPVTEDQIHTDNLEECIFQCDLFHSFGACDWFLYDNTDGMDENCHLFGPGREPMKDYLDSCNDRGRPTRDIDNTCYIDPLSDPVHFCDSTDRCPGGCKTCAADDICDKIHETECVMSTEGTDNSNSAPTADGCNYFCTAEGLSGDVSYLVYSLREERCVCHYTGKRFCNNIIMEWGATLDDYIRCGHPEPHLMIRLHLLVAIPTMTASILLPSFVTTQTESANQAAMCTRTATATSTASATKGRDVLVEVLDLADLDVEIREALAH